MERTVPRVASEEIDLYLRTYYSLLRASTEVRIRALEEAHAGMNSLLHANARGPQPDMSAFIYCLLRLPAEINRADLVVLGQSLGVFSKRGIGKIETWQRVSAAARRRRSFFDGESTLACLIASRSDIDDIVPALTAYQIEWNKLHYLLREFPDKESLHKVFGDQALQKRLADALLISHDDLERLVAIWGEQIGDELELIASSKRDIRIQLLSGSLRDYRRATHAWWDRIESAFPGLGERPVYFVSSNTHSLANLITGFALQHQQELLDFLEESGDTHLREEWKDIESEEVPSSRENFFYYLLKKYLATDAGEELKALQQEQWQALGILHVDSEHSFDLDAQVIPLAAVDPQDIDPRISAEDLSYLAQSDALILNIDYPLGMAAIDMLQEVAENVGEVIGVYVMGKAATLNGVVGDVMIPNVLYDGHSRNTYLFENCFDAATVGAYLSYGTALDNQKAVTVRGTFLQNATYMDVFYREGYTDIEMEAGPYLSAVYEMARPKRHPQDEIVNLYDLPFDLGIMHYASDKPLSKGKNLGVARISYFGMDPTYATTIPILKRIFALERERIGRQQALPV
jgi:hypothetical protein